MTPSVRDVLRGVQTALSTPASPDAGPDYAASRFGLAAMLMNLAAQDAEKCAGAALTENADIRALFGRLATRYDTAPVGALAQAAAEIDTDLSVPALDAANARLRRQLIGLHEAVETAADAAADAEILDLYVRMAAARRLGLGG